MTRIILVLASGWMVGCAPCSVSPPETFQGELILAGADPDAVSDTIDLPNLPSVSVSSVNGKTGVGIFQANTGQPYLTLGDTDSDGVFDMLTYSSLSADGEVLVDVEDYGMDGQPDFILNFKDNSASVFYNGVWLPVSGVGLEPPGATVEIEGENRPLNDVLAEIGRRPF